MERACVSTGVANVAAGRLNETVGFCVMNGFSDYVKPAPQPRRLACPMYMMGRHKRKSAKQAGRPRRACAAAPVVIECAAKSAGRGVAW
jgi:hypothetical protein